MGLKKAQTAFSTEFPDAYIRIKKMVITPREETKPDGSVKKPFYAEIVILVYSSKESRDNGDRAVDALRDQFKLEKTSDKNFFKQGYQYIKTLQRFENAEDVLESEELTEETDERS